MSNLACAISKNSLAFSDFDGRALKFLKRKVFSDKEHPNKGHFASD